MNWAENYEKIPLAGLRFMQFYQPVDCIAERVTHSQIKCTVNYGKFARQSVYFDKLHINRGPASQGMMWSLGMRLMTKCSQCTPPLSYLLTLSEPLSHESMKLTLPPNVNNLHKCKPNSKLPSCGEVKNILS